VLSQIRGSWRRSLATVGACRPTQRYRLFLPSETYPRLRHRRASTRSGVARARFKIDTELAKLAMKTLRCIERVHQCPILAQVGNQTTILEFDDEDRIARSSYSVNSGWRVRD